MLRGLHSEVDVLYPCAEFPDVGGESFPFGEIPEVSGNNYSAVIQDREIRWYHPGSLLVRPVANAEAYFYRR